MLHSTRRLALAANVTARVTYTRETTKGAARLFHIGGIVHLAQTGQLKQLQATRANAAVCLLSMLLMLLLEVMHRLVTLMLMPRLNSRSRS